MIRIGINGFGRMGRLAFRAAWDCTDVAVVHINEIKGGAATAAHLLEFDSVHGRWSKSMQGRRGRTDGRGRVRSSSRLNQSRIEVPWEASNVDIVLECSGKLLTPEALQPFFERGVRKVIVAAPVKQGRTEHRHGRERRALLARRAPHCHRRLMHDQLSGSRGEGDSRRNRNSPRRDHHHARRDEHADDCRSPSQRPAARPVRPDVAHSDYDRFRNRHWADLSRACKAS